MELHLHKILKDEEMARGLPTKRKGHREDVEIVSDGAKPIRRHRHAKEEVLRVNAHFLMVVQVQ